jgi:hypothetical protein
MQRQRSKRLQRDAECEPDSHGLVHGAAYLFDQCFRNVANSDAGRAGDGHIDVLWPERIFRSDTAFLRDSGEWIPAHLSFVTGEHSCRREFTHFYAHGQCTLECYSRVFASCKMARSCALRTRSCPHSVVAGSLCDTAVGRSQALGSCGLSRNACGRVCGLRRWWRQPCGEVFYCHRDGAVRRNHEVGANSPRG